MRTRVCGSQRCAVWTPCSRQSRTPRQPVFMATSGRPIISCRRVPRLRHSLIRTVSHRRIKPSTSLRCSATIPQKISAGTLHPQFFGAPYSSQARLPSRSLTVTSAREQNLARPGDRIDSSANTLHHVPVKLTELVQDRVGSPWLTTALGGPGDRQCTPRDDPRPHYVDVDS